VKEGISYAWHTPQVLFFFILLAFLGTFGYNFTVLIPLVAEFVLGLGAREFGMLTSALGAGSLCAALGIAAFGRLSPRALVVATGVFIALFAAIGVSESYYLTAGLLACLGIVSVLFSTTINTTLQIIVPDELRGRVMSIFFLLFAGSTPVGGYLTGVMAEAWGVRATLYVLAVICAVGLAVAVAYRQFAGLPWREAGGPELAPEQPLAHAAG
jgi:MFS family permease